ncbi:hypothetical protein DY000_02039889 [Brassica cretica]|uniref:Uncharacterized protein n=1 Tax=Brassica cretica TaxID=69181 RepID=A0ABQ7BPV0_BRACR|nr:hypothetical protein DY000_02039889 [Brassica cretica]
MAPSFSFPLPPITADRLEELYTVLGVHRAVVFDLASTSESPEAVRDGYCGAYLSFFETCGLFFPIPEAIFNILEELGLSLTQMCPNFLRHLLALLVKAREEGLLFGLDELRHLVLMKRNNQNPWTFLMSPRPSHQIIQGVPYRDQNWREEFFVFKIDEASVGSFDFSRLPRYWAEDIVHSGRSSMTDGLRGLIRALRRGGGSPSNPPPSDRLERQLARRSLFCTSRSALAGKAASGLPLIPIPDSDDEGSPEGRRPPVPLSSGLQDNSSAASHKRRRSSKAVMQEPSRSK